MTQEGETGAYHPTFEGKFDGVRRLRVEFRPEGEGHRPAVRMTTTFKRGGASGARARETFIENHLRADDSYTSHYVEEEQAEYLRQVPILELAFAPRSRHPFSHDDAAIIKVFLTILVFLTAYSVQRDTNGLDDRSG